MTDFRFERTGRIGLLHLYGELTESCVDTLQQGFMVSFENSDYVVVNFANVTGFDASCFKLFCSAYRIFTKFNKRLLLIGLGPKVFKAKDTKDHPECRSHCVPECRDGCLFSGIKNGSVE